jgi:hypothetical protein
MKLDDSQSSLAYFRSFADLTARLAKAKVAVYEHSFTYMAFGSWEIVAGNRKKMLRFTYEGKESYLSFCDAAVRPESHADLQHRRFSTHTGEDPFAFVAEVLEKEFPV